MRGNNAMLDIVWSIPHSAKGNCYVFGLGPRRGKGGYYKGRTQKARPGDKCETTPGCCYRDRPFNFKDCKAFVRRILCDNPKHVKFLPKKVTWKTKLPKGTHMMSAILSPTGHNDFHFLRRFDIGQIRRVWGKLNERTPEPANSQIRALFALRQKQQKECNVLGKVTPRIYVWGHQRGWMAGGPVVCDAKQNIIRDVKRANFNYNGLNYKLFCGYFKVNTRYATVTTQFDK